MIPRGHFRRFFFVFLVLTGAAGGPALRGDTSAPAPRVLRAGVETYAAPLTLADEAGKPTGFAVELLQAVAREQKLEVHYELMAWPDLLAAFKAGQLDIVCNISATPERRAYVGFTATTLLMRGGLFRREPSAPISSLADLKGRRLAVPRDSRAHEYFKTHDLGLELVFARTLRECIVTVHEGRADLVFASQIVAEHEIVTAGYRDIVPVDLLFPDFDYRQHFGVQPADTELLAQLNEGLLAVTRDGTYDRLYEKWLGPLQRRVRWRDLRPYVLPLLLIIALGLCGLAWQRRLLRQISQQADAL
ncbi:MAG TPA: transporter substrate-binding domain-containing protein, partial [Candidatus Didemnitutus sp.]|nr:transporter substrate-binding domain-containing protein [Candidatus Didemnitutus sp.]